METEFEVPSPHEKAVEQAAEEERGFSQKVALMTAVLATVGALIGYESGSAQNESMVLKNESILKQAQASDQWAFYQAKAVKEYVGDATAAAAVEPSVKARFEASRAKESAEKDVVRAEAERLQAQSRKLGEESEAKLRPHERLALALTCVQIAIALAAITVVTRRRWLPWGSGGAALVGIGAAISAMLMR